jgi:methionyl-tRNA formyltransferase
MGTPELACASLEALLAIPGFEVVTVITQPDRPKGRNLELQPSPVKKLALRRGLLVLQPEKARNESFIDSLRRLEPDLVAVAAYGQILPPALLELPRFGCLNVHTSLLPKYRGAAPIQRAVLNDEQETGVTIMKMDAGLDTGDILSQERTSISDDDDAQSLHDRLAVLGARLLVQTISDYVAGKICPRPQPADGASYARKIVKDDGLIDWTQPARTIWSQVRGLVPWPGAFTRLPLPQSNLLKIWRADIAGVSASAGEIASADKTGIVVGCGHHALRILTLQREGARRLTPQQFLAGYPLKPGLHLG